MPEYLMVSFPERRKVMINGMFMGYTQTLLELEGGEYTVTLEPAGCSPLHHDIDLRGTSVMTPLEISFEEPR